MKRKDLIKYKKQIIENKKLKKLEQELVIINFLSLEIIEKINVFLHILAILFGITSLVEFSFHLNSFETFFEIATIIVILIIVVWELTKPFMKRFILKRKINFIWGNRRYKTRLSVIERISIGKEKNNGELISILDQKNYDSIQDIWFGYTNNVFNKKFIYKIQLKGTWRKILTEGIEDTENKVLFAKMVPSFILLDMKEKTIELTSKNTLIYSDDKILFETLKTPIIFKINYDKKEMNWSGTLPNNPTHGNWKLTEEEIVK